jgi:hypothetical protein
MKDELISQDRVDIETRKIKDAYYQRKSVKNRAMRGSEKDAEPLGKEESSVWRDDD